MKIIAIYSDPEDIPAEAGRIFGKGLSTNGIPSKAISLLPALRALEIGETAHFNMETSVLAEAESMRGSITNICDGNSRSAPMLPIKVATRIRSIRGEQHIFVRRIEDKTTHYNVSDL